MNIYQKLVEVRKSVPYLKKESQGHQYQYTGSSQVLASVRTKMDELGLMLISKVNAHNLIEGTTDKGKKEFMTELDIEFTWVNSEKPDETIVCTWYGQGVDSGEKGVGKALTYAEKYFILKTFNIATDKDDPDAFQEKAQSYTKPDPISQQTLNILSEKVSRFAEIRGKTAADVHKVLKFSDPLKLNETQGLQHIDQLNVWIKQAEQEGK